MDEWIKVNATKKEEVHVPIMIWVPPTNSQAGSRGCWVPKCWSISLRDLDFAWLSEFAGKLNGKDMGKHLKQALLWYLTDDHLKEWAPMSSLEYEDESEAESVVTPQESSSSSDSSTSASDDDERPVKKKKKPKK